MIKTNKPFTFITNGEAFADKNMISAGKLSMGKRNFILSCCNRAKFSEKSKLLMKKGKEAHEKVQKGIKTIDEYGYLKFRRDLHKGKEITLSELKVVSAEKCLYGIIDIITIQYKNKRLYIKVDELKSGWHSSYFLQLMVYAMICSDKHAKLVYEVPYKRKEGARRELGYLFPHPLSIKSISIDGRIRVLRNKTVAPFMEIMFQNEYFPAYANFATVVTRKVNEYKALMRQKVVDLSLYDHDANGRCCSNYPHICPKIPFKPKEKQKSFGTNKLLINSKVRV